MKSSLKVGYGEKVPNYVPVNSLSCYIFSHVLIYIIS